MAKPEYAPLEACTNRHAKLTTELQRMEDKIDRLFNLVTEIKVSVAQLQVNSNIVQDNMKSSNPVQWGHFTYIVGGILFAAMIWGGFVYNQLETMQATILEIQQQVK